VPTCGHVKHAAKAEKLGADAIVVPGSEGGGHTGAVPTSLLVSQTVDRVGVPVIAAGGFRDGRGLVAALAFGAAGIAMGTRFLLTAESPVPEQTKRRYVEAAVDDVVVTRQIDGLPQRVVLNELVRRLEGTGRVGGLLLALRSALALRAQTGASLRDLLTAGLAMRRHERLSRTQLLMAANAPILAKTAMTDGDPVRGYLPGGSVAGVLEDLPACAVLIVRFVREAEHPLATLTLRQE
jgi:NAD(P)H-dependent flavin oxidoreductase YrpB (nitropropane dioxygenase family)